MTRYQTNSDPKPLIYKEKLNCLFAVHFGETLDLQGFAALSSKLSTKLSTENLDNLKAPINQGLSALNACNF